MAFQIRQLLVFLGLEIPLLEMCLWSWRDRSDLAGLGQEFGDHHYQRPRLELF
jgi:hypothetical protein